MRTNKDKQKKKVINIILDIICGLLFLFATYGLVIKFTNNSIYLFGIRSDVVLSDSMSYVCKDPVVETFLEGHDDRLYRGDLVYSTKVKEDTELNLYDIVIFKSKDNGQETIHRIVQIYDGSLYKDGKERYIIRADTANVGSHDGAYTHDEIIAKYKSRVGGLGHIVLFFRSIFGLVLEIGLAMIILVFQYLDDKYYGKKNITQSDTRSNVNQSGIGTDHKNKKTQETKTNQKNKQNQPIRSKETGRFVSNKKK